jgi:hypothetical protein
MHVRWLNLIFRFNTSTNDKVGIPRRLVWELVQNWNINKLFFQWHLRCINLNGWTNKKLSSQIYESNYERARDVFKPLTWWDGERWWERSYQIRVRQKKNCKNYFLFELSRATSRADPNSNSAHLTTEPD